MATRKSTAKAPSGDEAVATKADGQERAPADLEAAAADGYIGTVGGDPDRTEYADLREGTAGSPPADK